MKRINYLNKPVKIILLCFFVFFLVFVGYVGEKDARSEPAQIAAGQTTAYAPGDYNESIVTTDQRTRTYILHIPLGFAASKSYPLVLVFHGGYGTAALIKKGTHFDAKADANGFIVVFPNGVGEHWNDGRGTVNAGIDDVGFVRQLIASLQARLPIDAKRIYATGPSNGGKFSELLGCDLSDLLAAIGPDIGPMPTALLPKCKPARPIAVIGIQGGADPIVPLAGGEVASSALFDLGKGGMVESAATTMNFWASADACDLKPTLVHETATVNDGTSVDKYTYSGCKSGSPVVYYIVQGMGHAWPPHPGRAPQITGPTSRNINATDVIWDFFAAQSR